MVRYYIPGLKAIDEGNGGDVAKLGGVVVGDKIF